jgi:threonyl-tRNA synthetase
MGKKIRNAVTSKIPNVLVVGEREMEDGTVTLRRYGVQEQETMAFGSLGIEAEVVVFGQGVGVEDLRDPEKPA